MQAVSKSTGMVWAVMRNKSWKTRRETHVRRSRVSRHSIRRWPGSQSGGCDRVAAAGRWRTKARIRHSPR